jgi:glycosyltransferase involved in cell wall biosynthesis
MKIAIDSGPLTSGHVKRGIGVNTKELINALGKRVNAVDFRSADLSKYDIAHFTAFRPFFISLPFWKPKGTKFILTIHDLIPLIYPKHYPPGTKGTINFWINKFLIYKNVDAIITISETSKKDICRFLGVKPEKIFVVYLAPKEVFRPIEDKKQLETVKKKYHLPPSFALYVGDVNYNKNTPGLVRMCKDAGIKLVIAGKQAIEIEKMNLDHAELRHLKGVDWGEVIRLGFVPDEDLACLYNLADVYIQPSFYEGFSFPVLEAKACGTWVIATKIQTHEEIMDNKRSYSWEKTAKETLEVYEKI